jgi:hypothetical protein
MQDRRFHFSFPWITLYMAILIPLFTYSYAYLPQSMQNGVTMWLTSPFNTFYEVGSVSSFFLNYILVVVIFLFVELYTRNIANLKGRDSLIRNAFLFSVLSSYIVSAIVWGIIGFPSSGTSVMVFDILLFSAVETYDAELIKRMSKRRLDMHRVLEIISLVFAVLVIITSMLLLIYLNGNAFWYVHIAGGAIFVLIYYVYLSRWVRSRLDMLEEKVEKDVETDLEKTGIKIEEETEKFEGSIKKDMEVERKKLRRARKSR